MLKCKRLVNGLSYQVLRFVVKQLINIITRIYKPTCSLPSHVFYRVINLEICDIAAVRVANEKKSH